MNESKRESQRILSELQAKCQALEADVSNAVAAKEKAEQRATECTFLWESEVQSRTKLGTKMMEMEKFAATWEDRVNKERERTTLACERKKDLESKADDLHGRNAELQARVATAEQKQEILERELDGYVLTVHFNPARLHFPVGARLSFWLTLHACIQVQIGGC
jgi:hypothetical protein